ncbi:MAG: pyridoxamine 5'-phosphate oxidase family protein [bacterium]
MRWDLFADRCPELATLARDRFTRDQLVLLGTLRRDGSPRISPCEVDFAAGHLFLGMMWQSQKALDLRRDARLVVHSVTTNKEGTDGDVKLYGRAGEISEPALRAAFRQAIQARINWAPEEPEYHLFALDVERAAYVVFADGRQQTLIWDPVRGLRRRAGSH